MNSSVYSLLNGKLSFSKLARDSQNTQTQTQNSNTQKIKPKLTLLALI
jgi:hypothetical protein